MKLTVQSSVVNDNQVIDSRARHRWIRAAGTDERTEEGKSRHGCIREGPTAQQCGHLGRRWPRSRGLADGRITGIERRQDFGTHIGRDESPRAAVAERLRYRPNMTARALTHRRMNTIGVVTHLMGDEPDLYFLEVLSGIMRGATAAGQSTTMSVPITPAQPA